MSYFSAAGSYHDELIATAKAIASTGKGILAADESTGNIEGKFKALNIPCTEETRRQYREMLLTSPGIGNFISGVIFFEETLYQSTASGKPFVQVCKENGIAIGIKVDKGLKVLPGTDGEQYVQGLTDLGDRCKKYYEHGARFAKWRAVYSIGPNKPSELIVQTEANDLARYAAVCQANGLCPIVEPEVLMDGNHTIEMAAKVSERVYSAVVKALHDNGVLLEGMLLKPNMVMNGMDSGIANDPSVVADYTVRTLRRTLPAAVPGVTFLSGGQGEEAATQCLNAMNKGQKHPWALTFSYGRALQKTAMNTWAGKAENVKAAQDAFINRAKANSLAQRGEYHGEAATASSNESLYVKGYTY